jgi:putative ABC transport system permease protein
MIRKLYYSAVRQLSRNRTAAILNISGIAIGIATCMVIAIWAERELSFDDFHSNVDKKYRLWNTFTSESEIFSQAPSATALGAQLPKHVPAIIRACRVFNTNFKFRYNDKAFFEQRAITADSNFFSFFNFKLLHGNVYNVLHSGNDLVLTEATAIKYFGSAESAFGKTLLIDEQPMTISGVAADPPLNSHIQFDAVLPYARLHAFALTRWNDDMDNTWVGGWPHTYIEIADHAKPGDVLQIVNEVIARFSKKEWEDNKMSYAYFMQPVRDIHLQSALRYDSANNGNLLTVRVFVAVAVFILILACVNYINLTTATALRRAKEISLRKVSGASRRQLMTQFFAETFIVSLFAVGIAVVLLQLSLPLLSSWMGQEYRFSFNLVNVLVLAAFVLVVTLTSGFYPSVILSSFKPVESLKGRFAHSLRGQSARKTLVVLQFTISTVLLISILTVDHQMTFIREASVGYRADALVSVNFNGDESVIGKYDAIRNELLSAPYVLGVTRHNGNVVGGLGNGWITTRNNEGKEVVTSIYRMSVDADYFDTYGMDLLAGRTFSKGTGDSTGSVIVNEAAVKNIGWPTAQEAIGKPFGSGENTRYVIGVVRDFHFESLHKRVDPLLIGHVRGGSNISLRIEGAHLSDGIHHLQQVWSKLAPGVPLQYAFVDDTLKEQYATEQKMEAVFNIFAGLSFLIACMGLFGLSTFIMQQRNREIGIRKVLGAREAGLVVLLTTDFLKPVLLSALIAIPIGWYAMDQWLQTFAYHTSITWWILTLAVTIPTVIAVLTVSVQSVKTSLVNPATTLRTE